MTFSDIFIIYFACGSPLAVYVSMQDLSLLFENKYLNTLAAFMFWPIGLGLIAAKKILESENSSKSAVDHQLAILQKKIEAAANQIGGTSAVFDSREVGERYAGLTSQLAIETSEPVENDLYKISEHTNGKLAAVCRHRKNLERLRFHQLRARNDFVDLISMIFNETTDKSVVESALEIAALIRDAEAFTDLNLITNVRTEPAANAFAGSEEEVWKPKIQTAAASN